MLCDADDQLLALDKPTQFQLNWLFEADNVDEVKRGIEMHFPTLTGLSKLCNWMSSEPDMVSNALIFRRRKGEMNILYAINEDEVFPLCRRMASFLSGFVGTVLLCNSN